MSVQQRDDAPAEPSGGVLVDGAYQLVAETVHGVVPPDFTGPHRGDGVERKLSLDCDVVNELYMGDSTIGAGNACHRLVSRSPSLLAVSGVEASSGSLAPDAREQAAYTAHGDRLTLTFRYPYSGAVGRPLLRRTVTLRRLPPRRR